MYVLSKKMKLFFIVDQPFIEGKWEAKFTFPSNSDTSSEHSFNGDLLYSFMKSLQLYATQQSFCRIYILNKVSQKKRSLKLSQSSITSNDSLNCCELLVNI